LGNSLTSPKIEIAQSYLPKQASEEEIISWIKENIEFSNYKNKMQANGSHYENSLKDLMGLFLKIFY